MTTTQAHEFSYDGLVLTGLDSRGSLWTVEAADGWHAGAPLRNQRQVKSGQDGEWPGKPLRGARVIRLQGRVFAPDLAVLEGNARDLASAPLTGTVTGSSVFGDLSASCLMDDQPQFEALTDTKAIWQIVLVAPDPLLYGSPTFAQTSLASTAAGTGLVYPLAYPLDYGVPAGVTPGAVSLANAGTASYWPRLRIDGPVPNPTVTLVETGDWVHFEGTVTAGQWLDFDLANRRVLLNGQVSVRTNVSSSGAWLAVPPGGGSISWTADAADPAASLSVWGYEGAWT